MFKRSRIKIIVAIMAALLLFLLIMTGMIYGSSYRELSKENRGMLERYSDDFRLEQAIMEKGGYGGDYGTYSQPQMPAFPGGPHGPSSWDGSEFEESRNQDDDPEDDDADDNDDFDDNDPGDDMLPPAIRDDRDLHAFAVSSFYYTAFDENGEPIITGCGNGEVYSEDDISSMAAEILESGKTQGSEGDLIYKVTEKDDCTLVAFMDNTVVRDSMETFLKYAFISFGISAVLVFFLALILSKRIIKPLEENDQRQKQFISDAGHELKTPIAVMNSNLELLSRDVGEDNQWLSNVQYENERMGVLVTQLLELSRAENGTLSKEDLDLSNLVTGEALPFESIAFEQGLSLESNIEEGIHIQGNAGQLRQLTAILIDNAISHSQGGDSVDISLRTDRHQAVLSVTNSGPEIPKDVRDKLFERFYRTDEARTGGSGHYGLGLAIARAIVQGHSGVISVDCADGKVTFKAALPMNN